MTTPGPMDDIRTPYSVRFYADGTQSVLAVEADNRNAGGALWHRLLPGGYMIQLVLDGVASESAHIRWQPDGAGDIAVCPIPAGASRNRISAPLSVLTSRTGARFAVETSPTPNGGLNGGTRAFVRVIPDQDYNQ